MRHLERWKRYCLGDGGVYFDRRPETLNALNRSLCREMVRALELSASASNGGGGVNNRDSGVSGDAGVGGDGFDVECVILSTCARLEIILSVDIQSPLSLSSVPSSKPSMTMMISNEEIETLVKTTTAQFLSNQVVSYRRGKRLSFLLHKLLPMVSIFDRPARIVPHRSDNGDLSPTDRQRQKWRLRNIVHPNHDRTRQLTSDFTQQILTALTYESGIEPIARRMCFLATGLLPSHTDPGVSIGDTTNTTATTTAATPTIATDFRPFSARDSHVVAQMKRSAAGASRLLSTRTLRPGFAASAGPPPPRSPGVPSVKLLPIMSQPIIG